jgi:hypothetical protein
MSAEREADLISLLCVHFMHFKQVEPNKVIMDMVFVGRSRENSTKYPGYQLCY